VVDTTGGAEALVLTSVLRAAGVRVDRAFSIDAGEQRSMKSQMKLADRSGARLAIIIGTNEVADGTVVVRQLRNGSGQRAVPRADLLDHLERSST